MLQNTYGLSSRWMDDVAVCDIKDKDAIKPIRFEFSGTMVGVFGEADEKGLGFRALIDGKPAMYRANKKAVPVELWPFDTKRFGSGRLFMWRLLSDELTPGRHTLEIRPEFESGEPKSQLRVESICFAGE